MTVRRPLAFAALATLAFTMSSWAGPVAYTFDKNHTEVRFCWNHLGFSRQCAHFLKFDGEVLYDEANPENGKLSVTFQTDSIETRVPVFNEHMKGEKLFDTKNFPEATFKSAKFIKTGEKSGKILGELTIKGVTKPVTLDVTLNSAGTHPVSKKPTIGIGAITSVKRTEFGVSQGAPFVSDEVSIEIQSELQQKS